MTPLGPRRMFFIHVMKTGGTTFLFLARQNYRPEQLRLPGPTDVPDFLKAVGTYTSVRGLADEPEDRLRSFGFVGGHMPFVASGLVDDDVLKVSVLRDPVDRTISYLKHCQRMNPEHQDLTLEEIYDDSWFFTRLMRDHQTKMFSMTLDETLGPQLVNGGMDSPMTARCIMDLMDSEYARPIEPIDRARLDVAKANLERLDVLGLHERYDEFLGQMADVVGWNIDGVGRANVSDAADISPALRARIAEDNQLDAELVAHARSLLA